MNPHPHRVKLLPGWLNSDPGHWQSLWQQHYGYARIEQADWEWPLRGDWMARLDECLLDDTGLANAPALLVAHSLGCQLVAAWATHSRHTHRVLGALLVAPPDTERNDMPAQLHNWRPIVRDKLPFPATMVISSDDPYCAPESAARMAQDWGAAIVHIGPHGHINTESSLGLWPEGHALLQALNCETAHLQSQK